MIFLYNLFVVPLMVFGTLIMAMFNKKIYLGLKGRKNLFKNLKKSLSHFDKNQKRVLVHSSSVGEWLQAKPIVEKLKKIDPDIVIIASFFSPSGYHFVGNGSELIDIKTYLPFDTYFRAKKFLKLVKPSFGIISKIDAWPNHLVWAKKLQIPTFLTCATLTASSKRNKGFIGKFHRAIYKNFTNILPISQDDRERFQKIYPYPDRIVVTGDTKFDALVSRANLPTKPILKYCDKDTVFIAGSLWLEDEKRVIPALKKIVAKHKNFKIILAPHELNHLERLENYFPKIVRFTNLKKGKLPNIILVDTIGDLCNLYRSSDIAYVGGSFGKNGIHNVIEPAVFGNLVIFGPHYKSSFEAESLVALGGAIVVPDALKIEKTIEKFIQKDRSILSSCKICQDYTKSKTGATDKIISLLKKNI